MASDHSGTYQVDPTLQGVLESCKAKAVHECPRRVPLVQSFLQLP